MFFKGATCSALLKILRCRNMGAWHIQQMNGVGRMCNLWVFLSNFLDVLKMRIKKPEWKWTCEDYLRIIKKINGILSRVACLLVQIHHLLTVFHPFFCVSLLCSTNISLKCPLRQVVFNI